MYCIGFWEDISQRISIKNYGTCRDKHVSSFFERIMHVPMLPLCRQHDEIARGIVGPHPIYVVNNSAFRRIHYLAMLGSALPPTDYYIAVGYTGIASRCPSSIRMKRVPVQPPLLPVLKAPTSRCSHSVTMCALLLGRPSVDPEWAIPVSFVVHGAHLASGELAVAPINNADSSHLPILLYGTANKGSHKETSGGSA